MSVLQKVKDSTIVIFWCAGCDEHHQIDTAKWTFNGDLDKPTFSPSYLTWLDPSPKADPKYGNGKFRDGFRCHSYIREGSIEYLSDCTHKLAGQTVRLKEIER